MVLRPKMDRWLALAIFVLGAAAGAVTTAALYSAHIHDLRRCIEALPHASPEQPTAPKPDEDQRKSA